MRSPQGSGAAETIVDGQGSSTVMAVEPAGNADVEINHLTIRNGNAQAGGGILSTVRATREATEEQLLTAALPRARALMRDGVATIEIKSGYGLDIDTASLETARQNARINGLLERLTLTHGGPDVATERWPPVLANVLAAPLMEMAPALVRSVAHRGRVVLSGMPVSLEREVGDAYRRLGMRSVGATSRAGWSALVLEASW